MVIMSALHIAVRIEFKFEVPASIITLTHVRLVDAVNERNVVHVGSVLSIQVQRYMEVAWKMTSSYLSIGRIKV